MRPEDSNPGTRAETNSNTHNGQYVCVVASVATTRMATVDDAESIAALAIQVFLDTYATDGVRPDLAREALSEYSREQFEQRLQDPGRTFVLATLGLGLLGFAEILVDPQPSPIAGVAGAELVRLYVQPRGQHAGVGRTLIARAEAAAAQAGAAGLWLTVWDGNTHALGFYDHLGYSDIGHTSYTMQSQSFGNRVLYKVVESLSDSQPLRPASSGPSATT